MTTPGRMSGLADENQIRLILRVFLAVYLLAPYGYDRTIAS
jgi:hypothetical protein